MKLAYILKKGLQCYPPCLAQMLYLNDLGMDMVVYHGNNSKYIDKILEDRGIEHHQFESDRDNMTSLQSYINFLTYTHEARKVLSELSSDTILWFGNLESAMTLGKKIFKFKFVLSVLELYDEGSMYEKLLMKIIHHAEQVICCEKHRAVIMKDRYGLESVPHVIPNKPYPINDEMVNDSNVAMIKENYPNKKFIIYQGVVRSDRPIDNIAKALKNIGNDEWVLLVLGKADDDYVNVIKGIYADTCFMGYIPAPEHLRVTSLAQIGVAIYDDSNLNNQFCAPNKIYEYAKYGMPMITSTNLGLSETVGEFGAGKCVDFRDVDVLSEALQDIMNRYDEYSNNSRKFYDNTNIRDLIRNVVDAL